MLKLIQFFDWQSADGKCQITFSVTRMLDDIISGKLATEVLVASLDTDFDSTWIVQRDLNAKHVMTIMRDEATLNSPVLGVWMPNGSVLLIDGSHRYMARYLLHKPTIDYMLIALNDWKPYATITGDL